MHNPPVGLGFLIIMGSFAAAVSTLEGVPIFADGFESGNVSACSAATEVCKSGIDEDGDGFTDCDDFDCIGIPPCP